MSESKEGFGTVTESNVIAFKKREKAPEPGFEVTLELLLTKEGEVIDATSYGMTDYHGDYLTLGRALHSLAWMAADHHRDTNGVGDLDELVFSVHVTRGARVTVHGDPDSFPYGSEQYQWLRKMLVQALRLAPLSSSEVENVFGKTSQVP